MGSGVYREGHAPVMEALHRTQQCLLRIRCRGLLAVIVLLGFAYAPASPAPVPIPPAPYDTPSISHFPESRHPHDIPRLLLLHDFPVKNTEREAVDNSLKFARQKYKSLMKYIEDTEKIEVTALPISSQPQLFAFGESVFHFILIISSSDKQQIREQTVKDILSWLDSGGEESQGADHEVHGYQKQQQQQQQLAGLRKEQPQEQQQQYYSPVEKSRSLILLLGPSASPSLLQLAAAVFGADALAPSFLQQQIADAFNAISLNKLGKKQQQQPHGTVFAVRDLLSGHPHVVTPLSEDELLLYSGAYHLGSLQVGCGGRHCAKEVLPPYAFPLLLAPPTAFALENNIRSSSSSNNNSTSRMALASASQMRGNNRVLLLSGPDACSSIFTSLESIPLNGYEFKVANDRFCTEVLAWALNRRGVLRWSNVKHQKVGNGDSHMYTVGEHLRFSVDLHELKGGSWHPFEGNDVQLEYSLGDPLIRLFLQRQNGSPTFSTEFKAPDRAGILKFVLRHARVGYSSLLIHSLAPLRTPRFDAAERFHLGGAFYYFVVILVLFAISEIRSAAQEGMRRPLAFPHASEPSPSSSEDEDAAERALRFRVYTTKAKDAGGPSRPQHVVDKPIVWGPAVMPLSAIIDCQDKEAAGAARRSRSDVKGVWECFVLKGVLSNAECQRIIESAESQGFEYWAKEADTGASMSPSVDSANSKNSADDRNERSENVSPSSRLSKKANHSYRSAHTLEVEHPDLAEVIWQRVGNLVVKEVHFSPDDAERFERDLEGTWEACGVNSTLLFARYASGENFGPHTDGCTIKDFNCRSLWPMVIYLNTPETGGETAILKEAQKDLPFKTDAAGRLTADPECVVYSCKAKVGNALLFYQAQMHEGRPVGNGSVKYIIRTDIMYRRKEPLFTTPADKRAFALWQEAQLLAEKGETDAAAQLFRQMTKVSPELAHYYGM
ncbi:dolichyl-di-phosphooligosaccharide-protein glycotransferase, putative [Eimeria necatrix]|uniref:Dolichyl-di-phosphooligosaccharide-protein glycotransferase, putative n=1 Tax=Eimeria necatrix TaxID=51315 RepID=U6MQQ8_9EIME|nr:dolichyl-di-phosphooligosaccharide-protein glycotransferase, putative [Eimeria necatrix]CDJ66356.1 dolichyl-di-phosphooligosaccharide-protein glycotransferase, putative [Eimeria necatrix]